MGVRCIQSTDKVPETLDLTLAEAIRRGLQPNLGIINSTISLQESESVIKAGAKYAQFSN